MRGGAASGRGLREALLAKSGGDPGGSCGSCEALAWGLWAAVLCTLRRPGVLPPS